MPIGLTQGEMNSFAIDMLLLLPSECVTYKTTTGADIEVFGHFLEFTKHEMLIDPLLRNMRRFRMGIEALPMAPTRKDVLVRSDATKWDVDQVTGGPGRAYYFLTVRQVA